MATGIGMRLRRFRSRGFEPVEEDAGAGTHGRGSAAGVDAEQVEDSGELSGVLAGEVGEPLEGSGFYDGAGVFEVGVEGSGSAAAVGYGEWQAAEGESEIPAEFFELGFEEEAEEGVFGVGEYASDGWGRLTSEPFKDVGCALDHAWVVVPEKFDEALGEPRLRLNEGDNLGDTTDRESIFALGKKRTEAGFGWHGWRVIQKPGRQGCIK